MPYFKITFLGPLAELRHGLHSWSTLPHLFHQPQCWYFRIRLNSVQENLVISKEPDHQAQDDGHSRFTAGSHLCPQLLLRSAYKGADASDQEPTVVTATGPGASGLITCLHLKGRGGYECSWCCGTGLCLPCEGKSSGLPHYFLSRTCVHMFSVSLVSHITKGKNDKNVDHYPHLQVTHFQLIVLHTKHLMIITWLNFWQEMGSNFSYLLLDKLVWNRIPEECWAMHVLSWVAFSPYFPWYLGPQAGWEICHTYLIYHQCQYW